MKKHYKIELIDEFLKKNNMSKSGFCKECGISLHSLKKIYNQDFSLRVSKVLKVANKLGVSFSNFAN